LGPNRKSWMYAERYYEQLISQAQPDITPGDEELAFAHLNFALASRLEWDSQGRVLIPEKTLRRTGLEREITLIGAGDHMELWNRAEWEARREALLERSSEIAIRAKQARQTPRGEASR